MHICSLILFLRSTPFGNHLSNINKTDFCAWCLCNTRPRGFCYTQIRCCKLLSPMCGSRRQMCSVGEAFCSISTRKRSLKQRQPPIELCIALSSSGLALYWNPSATTNGLLSKIKDQGTIGTQFRGITPTEAKCDALDYVIAPIATEGRVTINKKTMWVMRFAERDTLLWTLIVQSPF